MFSLSLISNLKYQEINGLESNWTEDALHFFLEDGNTLQLPVARKSVTSIKVGTDCSGIEVPLMALQNMQVPYDHVFSCDNDQSVIKQHRDCMRFRTSSLPSEPQQHVFSVFLNRGIFV